jgi:hypothetical protein
MLRVRWNPPEEGSKPIDEKNGGHHAKTRDLMYHMSPLASLLRHGSNQRSDTLRHAVE